MFFTYEKLLKAYFSCRRQKRKTINALKFEFDFERKLLKLQKQLESHTYRLGRSICFVVTHPKPREIFAADFRDRIVHHLLVKEIEPYFEKHFIHNSFACRKEKGTHYTLNKVRSAFNKITKNKTQNAFYGQLDIKSFFINIDKEILFKIFKREIKKMRRHEEWKRQVLWLAEIIIFHNPAKNYYLKGEKRAFKQIPAHKTLFKAPKNKGLPIGNFTSQFFANVYLNELDQFIKRRLKIKYYFRYADDLLLLSKDLKSLKKWKDDINGFLQENLGLELHSGKQVFDSVYSGINFVGYIIKPNYVLARKRIVNNIKSKLYSFNQGLLLVSDNQKQRALPLSAPPTKKEICQMLAMVNSYYGHFQHAYSYNLRKGLYEKRFGKLKKYLEPKKEFLCYVQAE